MSWQTVGRGHRMHRWFWRLRRSAAALVVGLALVVAACGTTTPGGQSTTVKPTAAPTPIPCSAWRVVSSPNATQYQHNDLSAVSAASTTAAWAVGGSFTD